MKRNLQLSQGFVDRHTKINGAPRGTAKFDTERGNSITRRPQLIHVRIHGLATAATSRTLSPWIDTVNRPSTSWARQCLIEFMARIHGRTLLPISRGNSIDSIPPCQYSHITPWENENLLSLAHCPNIWKQCYFSILCSRNASLVLNTKITISVVLINFKLKAELLKLKWQKHSLRG